jgi:hypothetical protein
MLNGYMLFQEPQDVIMYTHTYLVHTLYCKGWSQLRSLQIPFQDATQVLDVLMGNISTLTVAGTGTILHQQDLEDTYNKSYKSYNPDKILRHIKTIYNNCVFLQSYSSRPSTSRSCVFPFRTGPENWMKHAMAGGKLGKSASVSPGSFMPMRIQ